ncbi:enoyl-CoA hydratase/isomerase family protein [Marinobacter sp.]|uniref:enoyl-CoA hydratase/isomerase family protein n=1 Tax=Marinobacter sp. TaxID=50741 RepID=UPI0034A103AE
MPIKAQELDCLEGRIGLITLDSPATLNALSGEMIDAAQRTLDDWAEDDQIALVILQGAGDRAFCAGGDIRQLYGAIADADQPSDASEFFAREYRLDYTLHRFPKPVVGIGHGVIMGGGLGLLTACRYRLITPDITMAMPEVAIGLFPDVGSSWFLNRLPGRLGLFMGLTGCHLNASDAIRVGLADMAIRGEDRNTLIDRLQSERWTGGAAANDNRLFRLLNQLHAVDYRALETSKLAAHEQDIARLGAGDDLPAIVDRLISADISSDWWQAAVSTLKTGCPVSMWLVWTQLKRAQQKSLKDVFRMELAIAAECTRRPDLAEGIRARLIDKDQKPQWSFRQLDDVPEDLINAHFRPEWDDENDPMGLD